MRLSLIAVAASGLCAAAGAAQAAAVEVKDAVARVTVIPEDRNDIRVELLSSNPNLPLEIKTFAGRTIVDGGLGRRIRGCHGSGPNARVMVRGVGEVGWRDMPQVVIRTPREANISTGGAVFGAVGRSAGLQLANAGCGDWTVANVQGRLRLSQAGSGDTRVGSAGEARIRVAGAGDVSTAEIRGPLQVEIAGSGDVSVASVAGPLGVHTVGSGDVRVHGGHASEMRVTIAGSGDVRFDGVADALKASIAGSGDVHVREVKGPVSKAIMGSGGVTFGS
jgi:hypothetical protein